MHDILQILRVGVVMASLLVLSACATSAGGYISGQTLDADTKQPIPDVAIMIKWKGQSSMGFVDSQSVCVAADSTVTDAEGKFKFMPWVKPTSPLIGGVHYGMLAYKRGYETGREKDRRHHVFYMGPFEGTVEERLKQLSLLSDNARCDEDEIYLLPFNRRIYDEANEIAITDKDKETVDVILFGIDSIEHGSVEAHKLREERKKDK